MESIISESIEFDEKEIKDFYVDAINVEAGIYGFNLTTGVARKNNKPLGLVRLKLSPQLTKVLRLILTKQIKSYEKEIGRIEIPDKVMKDLGLERKEVY